MKEKSVNDVLIVDALNLSFRYKHKKQFDFADDYIKTARSLAQSYGCGRIIFAADWGSSTFRKDILPEYKGNREEKRKEQTEDEKEEFQMFIEEFENTMGILEDEDYTVLRYKGVEADDIAAHLCKYKEKYGFDKIWLISSDRDWDLLLSEDISRFSYVTRKEYRYDNWDEYYDFAHEDYITYKCLVGDSGDNVPGVAGVGPKRAIALMEQYGNVFDIHNELPLSGKQKFVQNLNEFGDKLLTNVELMDLLTYCDEAIGKENCEDIEEKLNG